MQNSKEYSKTAEAGRTPSEEFCDKIKWVCFKELVVCNTRSFKRSMASVLESIGKNSGSQARKNMFRTRKAELMQYLPGHQISVSIYWNGDQNGL